MIRMSRISELSGTVALNATETFSTGPVMPLTATVEAILIPVPLGVASWGTSVELKVRVTAGNGVGVVVGVGVAVGDGVGWLPGGGCFEGRPGTGTLFGPPGTGTDPGAPGTGTGSAAARTRPCSCSVWTTVGPAGLRSADWQAVSNTRPRPKAIWLRAAFRIDPSSVPDIVAIVPVPPPRCQIPRSHTLPGLSP